MGVGVLKMGSVVGLDGARGAGLVDLAVQAYPVSDSSTMFGLRP